LNEYGQEIRLSTDARLVGNIMRFVNEDPGGSERNCRAMRSRTRIEYDERKIKEWSMDLLGWRDLGDTYCESIHTAR
jgi:hypothetical protein